MATEPERLAVLETEVRITTSTVERIESKLDKVADLITTNYAPRSEIDTIVKQLEAKIERNRSLAWTERIATVLVSSSVAGLVGFFISTVLSK